MLETVKTVPTGKFIALNRTLEKRKSLNNLSSHLKNREKGTK